MLKVLHITPWYPHAENGVEGIFIHKHIKALQRHCQNEVLHLHFGNKHSHQREFEGINVKREVLTTLVDKWKLKELAAKKFIAKYVTQHSTDFDIINFYIAYPNAIGLEALIKEFPGIQFIITEQWSAYHEKFGLKEGSRGRNRIASIFKNKVPLFTVSNALASDIQEFTGLELPHKVVPNIVDEDFVYVEKQSNYPFTFCSINSWSAMKDPFVLIKAMNILRTSHPDMRLVLGGSGSLNSQMTEMVDKLDLSEVVSIRGRLTKDEVIELLHTSQVYCQSSRYETFSAICVEALATGTPVIATKIGGMLDFVDETNGGLVTALEPNQWADKMAEIHADYNKFNAESISKNIIQRFSENKVGQDFYDKLASLVK